MTALSQQSPLRLMLAIISCWSRTARKRAQQYLLALATGLRSNEIRSLRCSKFHLDDSRPHLTVEAAYSKRRRTETILLLPYVVEAMRAHLASHMPRAFAFNLPASCNMARMLRKDLVAAGIEPETEDGRVDFHALRHTFVTQFVNSRVMPQVAKQLARHSTITLTMNHYTHVHLADELRALEPLPEFRPTDTEPAAAERTGTDCGKSLVPSLVPMGGFDATTSDTS